MAPSAKEVTDQLISFYGSGTFNSKAFESALAPEHSLSVAGHDFVLAGQDQSHKDFFTDVSGPIMNAVDQSKSIKYKVVRVITSGDSPWVAAETKTLATTKNGPIILMVSEI